MRTCGPSLSLRLGAGLLVGALLAVSARGDDSLKTAPWFDSLEAALVEPAAVLKLDLSDRGLEEFPTGILDLPNLRLLLLNNNRLASLPEGLGRLAQLSELELNQNAFDTFPRALLELSALNELELSGNRIAELPEDIDRLARLTELELLENELSTLPEAVARLVHLEELKLDHNRLVGVPPAIFALPALLEFTASGNLLTTLPDTLGSAAALREIDLSRNRLERLPSALLRLRPVSAAVWQESLPRLSSGELAWLLACPRNDAADFVLQLAEARRADDVVYYFDHYARAAAGAGPHQRAQACLVGARAFRDLGDGSRARELAGRARELFARLERVEGDDEDRAPLSRMAVYASLREADTLLDLVETEARQNRLRFLLRVALLAGLALVAGFFVLLARSHHRLRAAHERLSRQTALLEEQAARLERLNATKDKLFSLIGHDLRGPLSALGTLSTRLRPELSTPSARRLVSLLEGTALQLSALLDNLLGWAQSQIREARFEPTFLDLGELVAAVVGQYRALLEVKDIDLRVAVEDGLLVYGDATMLQTVVRNLLANAVKFSATGDRIAISARPLDGEIVLEVADTGVGMTREQLAGLFSSDSARSLAGTCGERGTGLGLLLCHDFVRRHEGRIEARGAPGAGCVFRVTLPACGLAVAGRT